MSWFDMRKKCCNGWISCVMKMLVACQLFLEIFPIMSQNNICKQILLKKNPAVLFTPVGNSARDGHNPVYHRLEVEDHILNVVFNLSATSQKRNFLLTLSNILDNISSRFLVVICTLFLIFPFFAQLALWALLWHIWWLLILWYLIFL